MISEKFKLRNDRFPRASPVWLYTAGICNTKNHSKSVVNAHRSLSNDVERNDERSDAKTE